MNKRRLGRGLEALLGRDEGGYEPSAGDSSELTYIPVDLIDPNPFQPRRVFDPTEVSALADSLRQHGLIQPVLARAVGERYQLIAGERRLRAAIEAHLHEIPARIMDLDDQRVSELAMVENLQREDLNPLDKAGAFRDYLARYGGTQEELAGRRARRTRPRGSSRGVQASRGGRTLGSPDRGAGHDRRANSRSSSYSQGPRAHWAGTGR